MGVLTEQDVPGWEPVMRALNTKAKYMASTTLADPAWLGITVLSDDLATAIAELNAKPGGAQHWRPHSATAGEPSG